MLKEFIKMLKEFINDPKIKIHLYMMGLCLIIIFSLIALKPEQTSLKISDFKITDCIKDDAIYSKNILIKGELSITLLYTDNNCETHIGYIDYH